jgi:hypothetical protein
MMQHLIEKVTTRLVMCLQLRTLTIGMTGLLSLIICQTAGAQCASILSDGNFEEQSSDRLGVPWYAEGRAAIDHRRGLGYQSDNNAWAGKIIGWNGIYHYPTVLTKGVLYTLTAFVRTSDDAQDVYFGFRNKDQSVAKETSKFGPVHTYREVKVLFRPARTDSYRVFIGFWSHSAESWIRVDDIRLGSACHDTNP